MKKAIYRSFVFVFLVLPGLASAATELQNYSQQCQSELHFNASDVRAIDCSDTGDGDFFAVGGGAVRDRVVHKTINSAVDLVAACRWAQGAFSASVELLIHNRQNGSTCFFAAKDDPNKPFFISPTVVSPTNFSAVHDPVNNPNADDFWLQPSELNAKVFPSNPDDARADKDNSRGAPTPTNDKLQCVGCHVQGPYIASLDIAPFLARFGLLNDGHDTTSDMTVPNHYHVVGSGTYDKPIPGTAFGAWDSIIFGNMTQDMNNKPVQDCSGACHNIGDKSSVGTLFVGDDTVRQLGRLIPSLKSDISFFKGTVNSGMPPEADDSPYHFINRDYPSNDGVEIETFTSSKKFPVLAACGVPTILTAHAVDSSAEFSTTDTAKLPDKLSVFNARDGLVCLSSDQPGGRQCNNYSVKYLCSDGKWSGVYNMDSPTFGGDHEERYRDANVCTSKPGLTVLAIQATTTVNGNDIVVNGPADRLAQFNPNGLICKNSDQSGGTCANYVVRYEACKFWTEAYLAKIKNSWTSPPTFGDRYLTTTANNVNDAETRAQANNYQYPSQDWVIEAVSGTNNVRLKDTWSGKYLTESLTNNSSGLAIVVVHNSDLSLMRQQWIVDDVANSTTGEKRIRNVGTGRYLTVGNYTSDPYFAPIVSQAYSTQNWASQRWFIQ